MINVNEMIEARRSIVNEENQLTPELIQELKDAMLECTMRSLYCKEDTTYVMVSEGANIEMTKAFKTRMLNIKKLASTANKYNKSGEFEKCKSTLKDAIKEVDAFEKDIKGIDFTVGSAIFGFFVNGFISNIQMLVPNMVATFFTNKYSKNVVNVRMSSMSDYFDSMENFVNDDDADPSEMFNAFRNVASSSANVPGYKSMKIANFLQKAIALIKTVREIHSIYKRYKAGDSNREALNIYRNKMLMICSDLKALFNAMYDSVDRRSKMK